MPQYTNEIKRKITNLICVEGKSTIKTAREYDIPLKTIEKWITAYNKDNSCFNKDNQINDFHIISNSPISDNLINYDDLSNSELRDLLMKKDIQIERLKKNYQVTNDGMGNKVFITFLKKNMK